MGEENASKLGGRVWLTYLTAWGSAHLPAPGEYPRSTQATLGPSAASFLAVRPGVAGLAQKAWW